MNEEIGAGRAFAILKQKLIPEPSSDQFGG
jgi:hypothetical protein